MLESQPKHDSTDMDHLAAAVESLRQVDGVPRRVENEVMGALEHTERALVELAVGSDE